MKKVEYESLGVVCRFDAPETVEEFDQLIGPGACLECAIDEVVYRGILAEFRQKLCERLEKTYNIPRKTKPHPSGKKTADGQPIMVVAETEWEYVSRVAAEMGVEMSHFQQLADEVSRELRFVAKRRERKGPQPAKGDVELALQVLAQPEEGRQRALAELARATGPTLELTGDEEADVRRVAFAIKAMRQSLASRLVGPAK